MTKKNLNFFHLKLAYAKWIGRKKIDNVDETQELKYFSYQHI